ncbi:vWA domain-containing protein [Nannocystaceae bacterium ST9]
MSFSLLSPLLLLGLLGLALPLLAHLLGRERPQKIRFAAMRFVAPREPVITQRKAIRDWPLLLIRLLLLALLVFVLARPVVGSEAEVTVLAEPHDAVVLLDASASMELRVDGRSDRERARERLETLLEAMPPGSRIGLVISDPRAPQVELSEVGEGVARIRARVDEWSADEEYGPRPGAWTLAEALPQALGMLGERQGDRPRVVYAIGDPSGGGLGSLPAVAGEAITIVPVPTRGRPGAAAPEPPEHVGLRELSWEPAPELDPRALRISAIAHRFGGDESRLEVAVALIVGDEEVARTRVELIAEGDAPIEFVHTPTSASSEPLRVRVELVDRPDDPLPIDDRRVLWSTAQDALDVLVVNGDPSDTRTNDEIFFFSTALTSNADAMLEIRGLAPDQLEDQLREGDPLAEVDLLVLANVRAPASEAAAKIVARVNQGMGLWISVGDRVSANEYNERFAGVLPLLLREAVYTGTAPGRTEARSEGLAPINLAHPIFAGLSAGEGGDLDLGATRTKRMFLLDPDARRGADIALTFTSGAPALITREQGEGRVALLTTTIDRDWGDLPLRPGFVPLVVRTAQWLADVGGSESGGSLRIGAGKSLDRPAPYTVYTPGGEALAIAPEATGELAIFTRTDRPGHYRAVPNEGDETSAELFVVEVDPRESDTTPVAIAGAELEGEAGTVTIYAPRWRELAMLVLVLLGLESAVRWWLGRRARAA